MRQPCVHKHGASLAEKLRSEPHPAGLAPAARQVEGTGLSASSMHCQALPTNWMLAQLAAYRVDVSMHLTC